MSRGPLAQIAEPCAAAASHGCSNRRVSWPPSLSLRPSLHRIPPCVGLSKSQFISRLHSCAC